MNVGTVKALSVFIFFVMPAGVSHAAGLTSNDPNESQLVLLTDVQAGIGVAGVSGGDYDIKTARQVQFDILRLDKWFMHTGIQEISLFDPSPSQLDHTIGYLSAGWQTDAGRYSFFWDHTCNNPTRSFPAGKSNVIRWNELGIGYETHGMRLGHENDGIDFDSSSQWLNKIDWGVSFSRVWMHHKNDYHYMLKLALRDDWLRTGNHVLYAQFKLNTINSDRGTDFDPSIELGDRIRLAENLRLVPYVSYERYNDWYALDADEEFFFYGLRLEAALGPDRSGDLRQSKTRTGSFLSSDNVPLRFRIVGGYNTSIGGTHKNSSSSELLFDLDILEFDNKVLTLNTFAGLLTESGIAEVQNVNYKIGPSLKIDLADYYLRLFHSYSCLYGGDYDGLIRNYNLLGAEVADDDQLSWSLQAAAYPTTTNFDYDAHLQASLGYDLYESGMTPYIDGSLIYLIGGDSVTGNAVEGGLKIPGSLGSFVLYLRQEYSYDVFRFGKGEQRWLGFRLVF